MLISHKPKRQQLYYIFHLILNQSRFTYNTCYALGYYLRCYNCRRLKTLKRIKGAKKDVQLEKGGEMLSRDLDIVNLLEMIKYIHLMSSVLLSQDDRFFLQLQHRDMICTDTSEDEVTKIVKSDISSHQPSTTKHVNILEQKDLDQEQKETVRDILKRYEGRHLSDREFRILQGVLTSEFG